MSVNFYFLLAIAYAHSAIDNVVAGNVEEAIKDGAIAAIYTAMGLGDVNIGWALPT